MLRKRITNIHAGRICVPEMADMAEMAEMPDWVFTNFLGDLPYFLKTFVKKWRAENCEITRYEYPLYLSDRRNAPLERNYLEEIEQA